MNIYFKHPKWCAIFNWKIQQPQYRCTLSENKTPIFAYITINNTSNEIMTYTTCDTLLMRNKHIQTVKGATVGKSEISRREANSDAEKNSREDEETGSRKSRRERRKTEECEDPHLDVCLFVEQGLSCCNDKHRQKNTQSEVKNEQKQKKVQQQSRT